MIRKLCLDIARQIGWDGTGDYYQHIIDNLPKIGIGETASNPIIDQIADSMGWCGDYKDEFKTKQNFVAKNFTKAFSHYVDIAGKYREIEQDFFKLQIEIDQLKNQNGDLVAQIELYKQPRSSKID